MNAGLIITRLTILVVTIVCGIAWQCSIVAQADDTTITCDASDILLERGSTVAKTVAARHKGIRLFKYQFHPVVADVVEFLEAGQFAQSLDALSGKTTDQLAEAGDDTYWYLRGVALMGMGDNTAAGLSFMRVVVYYNNSKLRGMALYRLAWVHEQIDRLDIAIALYREVSFLPSTIYYSQPRGRGAQRLKELTVNG